MSIPSLGWDDTIRPSKPFSLSHNINSLSLSPENKRKRRYEDSPSSTHSSQQSTSPVYHVAKRSRNRASSTVNSAMYHLGIRRLLESLDKEQIVSLVENLVDLQPEALDIVEKLAPPPTVPQALRILVSYQQSINDKMPHGGSKTDYAFLRVKPQWTAFFVALDDFTHWFLSSTHSDASSSADLTQTFEFLDGATALLHSSPTWSNSQNNTLLVRSYTELTRAWIHVLEQASDSLRFVLMNGAAWEARFQNHCALSNGRMIDTREASQETLEKPVMGVALDIARCARAV